MEGGAARADKIIAFETALAKVHWTRVESRDADKTYNPMTPAQLARRRPASTGKPIWTGGLRRPASADRQPALGHQRICEAGRRDTDGSVARLPGLAPDQ
uniref:Peptidase M13 N-terminal domain-containing protein n=1 Tax=Phenylobacterium glaciei TaxID=2803784 RepID=A0A974P6C4_9CAUL|nr:hypothetical protein JKL49_20365 [Phenylobacterium glaciei]